MIFPQSRKGSHRDQSYVNLVIFEHAYQTGRVIQHQLDLMTDGTLLQSIDEWLCIQVTDRSNPYFPVHQDCRNFAASYTNPLL